jgi:hypothetical protein
VKNVDDRKRRLTLRDLLTLSSGFERDADGFQTGDPKNDTSVMEGSDDWVQYAIDKPMVAEPARSGITTTVLWCCSDTSFNRKPAMTLTTTLRNIYSHRWESGTNGSARIWEQWTPKGVCT